MENKSSDPPRAPMNCPYGYWETEPEKPSPMDEWWKEVGLKRIQKRWIWLVISLIAGVASGLIISIAILPKSYEARASIVPLQGREILGINPQIFGIELLEDILSANLPTSFDELSGIKIRAYLESNWLSRSIIEENDLAHELLDLPVNTRLQPLDLEKAVDQMHKKLVLDLPRMTDILSIRYIDTDPNHAAVIIQKFLDKLDEFLRRQTIARAESNATYLERVKSTLKDREMIERLNSLIMTQYEQVAYAQASGNIFFEVLEPPHPRYQPLGPIPIVHAMFSGFFALVLGAIIVLTCPQLSKL